MRLENPEMSGRNVREIADDRPDAAQAAYREARMAHWDSLARQPDRWTELGGYYHERLIEIYRFLVPPGQSIIELGCGHGDLLAALQPSSGVGVDFSPEQIERARSRHPSLRFIEGDVHDLDAGGPIRRHHSVRPRQRSLGRADGPRDMSGACATRGRASS